MVSSWLITCVVNITTNQVESVLIKDKEQWEAIGLAISKLYDRGYLWTRLIACEEVIEKDKGELYLIGDKND